MKSALNTLILVSFVGVAVFGIAAMNHGNGGHGGCIGSIARGVDCPEKEGPLAFINFHATTFKSFSTAIFDAPLIGISFLVLFALFFLARIARAFSAGVSDISFAFSAWQIRASEFFSYVAKRRLFHWFALHENSPNVL